MKEMILKTDKGNVFYWQPDSWNAEADTIVFLHGLTADHTMFDGQISYFEKDYNILTWDTPAHGRSRPFEAFDFNDTSEYMKQILDRCGIEQVILAGQSLGGYLSQSFIKRYPERVRAFIAIDSSPYGWEYYSKSDIWIVRQIEWMARLYPFTMLKKAMARQVSVTKAGYENMMEMLAPYEKNEMCHLMGIGYAGFLDDNSYLNIDCPVLLILGEKDRTGKVAHYNKVWSRKTGFPLKVIPGAAHNVNVDQPQAVNEAVQEFLKKVL
ncbi:MAG: alpha/beta hydrolase [Solobacterium sp.]|nr:alpha/beta hydrolase [Solobacterium sp.]